MCVSIGMYRGVAAVRRAGPVHMRAYGILDQESGVRADADSGFAIGSCSKAFTAASAATRVDRGELAWDDPIRKFLPQFQLYDPSPGLGPSGTLPAMRERATPS